MNEEAQKLEEKFNKQGNLVFIKTEIEEYDEPDEPEKMQIKEEFVPNEQDHNETIAYKCAHCSEVFKLFLAYRAHKKQHFVEKRTCKICQAVCKTVGELTTHLNKIHLGIRPFKCIICDKRFASKHELTLHMRCHSDEKRYKCLKCGEAFKYLESLRSHAVIHNNIKEFQCKDCSDTFETLQSFRKHLEVSHGQKTEITCQLCEKKFFTDRHLQIHLKTHSELTYPCEYCKRLYPSLYRLKRHIRRAHIPNVCDDCNDVFYDRSAFTKHVKEHREQNRKNICPHCTKFFDKTKNLSEHIRLQHTEDGNIHKCLLCNKQFINAALLKNHAKSHDKSFECKYCKKLFSSRYNLEIHSVTHTGQKNFKCDICDKAFSTKTGLKNHRGIHSEERTFNCDQCSKLFKTSRRLYVHKLSHATEEKYQCEICDARFRVKQYLKCHMIKHSDVKQYECKACRKQFKHKKSWLKHSDHDK